VEILDLNAKFVNPPIVSYLFDIYLLDFMIEYDDIVITFYSVSRIAHNCPCFQAEEAISPFGLKTIRQRFPVFYAIF
jgi:hypothetical protein